MNPKEYKFVSPLKTRHVEPWAEYVRDAKVLDMSLIAKNATVIRKAMEFGWFDLKEGDVIDVDEMVPADVVELGTRIWNAYSAAMGFDLPNSPARPRVTKKPKETVTPA